MILLLHIAIAISSILYTGYTLTSPSKSKLKYSYGMIGMTLLSGSYLVVSMNAHILQACITGLIYLSMMLFAVVAIQYRLAVVNDRD